MVLQVRVTDSDGTNPVILSASERSVFKRISSSDEGGKFTVPKNDPKSDVLNPETGGDTRLWEIWDTETNTRRNFGPITSITDMGSEWAVEGRGRSAFLEDYYGSLDTHYAKIDPIFDTLRFEYVSLLPKVSTLIPSPKSSTDQTTVFGSTIIDEKYYGLSTNTKDNVIDENPIDKQSFWAGMSTKDAIIVDLGDEIPLTKLFIRFPDWASKTRLHRAGRDYTVAFAAASGNVVTTLQNRTFGPFDEVYNTGLNTYVIDNPTFIIGNTLSGYYNQITYPDLYYIKQDVPGPVDARYIRVNISKVHMWEGTFHDAAPAVDAWNYYCNPNYVNGDDPGFSRAAPGILDENLNDRDLKPENDCDASIIDIVAGREILKPDLILPLALQRIDNNNLQITYTHIPDSSETITTSAGYRHFEPGGFFRKMEISWSGASTSYTKFYSTDCTNCYPDGFNFGVSDHNNTLIYSSDSSSGTNVSLKGHMFTKHVDMKGASDATVTYVDSWPAKRDPLSYGDSYSYTGITNDVVTVHFRGQSFKWYATIPQDKSAASVKIEIRHKNLAGAWTAYTTLENSYQLPSNVGAYPVYEISYESGTLLADTVYEIKITNLGGYCSVDSFEGYWSASMSEYNEDSTRLSVFRPEVVTQIFDGRFSHGTMYKWNQNNFISFAFEGDRVVLVSAKGRNHGKVTLILRDIGKAPYTYDSGISDHVFIPGGSLTDGSLQIDLSTGKRGEEIPQYILFDSNDYFPNGLPWSQYQIGCYLLTEDIETYSSYARDSDNFVHRCQDCTAPTGTAVTINKYVYFDGAFCHEKIGVSVKFQDQHYLDQLTSLTEAFQTEWSVTEQGLRVEPRIGIDSNIVLREGQNTVVNYQIVYDASILATQLLSSGADIDGLPLSTFTEDRINKRRIGRSITRKQDFRNLSSYTQMIGLSRTELKKRRYSEKRITVKYSGPRFPLIEGDTFVLYTKKLGKLRVRIDYIEEVESGDGRVWNTEVSKWPALQE